MRAPRLDPRSQHLHSRSRQTPSRYPLQASRPISTRPQPLELSRSHLPQRHTARPPSSRLHFGTPPTRLPSSHIAPPRPPRGHSTGPVSDILRPLQELLHLSRLSAAVATRGTCFSLRIGYPLHCAATLPLRPSDYTLNPKTPRQTASLLCQSPCSAFLRLKRPITRSLLRLAQPGTTSTDWLKTRPPARPSIRRTLTPSLVKPTLLTAEGRLTPHVSLITSANKTRFIRNISLTESPRWSTWLPNYAKWPLGPCGGYSSALRFL